MNFWIIFFISGKSPIAIAILIGIALNLYIILCRLEVNPLSDIYIYIYMYIYICIYIYVYIYKSSQF